MSLYRKFALGSFSHGGGQPFLGLLLDDRVTPVGRLLGMSGEPPTLRALLNDWDASFVALGEAVDRGLTDDGTCVEELFPHAPIPDPRQIFCTGANYANHSIQMLLAMKPPEIDGMTPEEAHAFAVERVTRQKRESDPYIFMKTVTSVAGPRDTLVLPDFSDRIDWEVELAVVIGRPAHRLARDSVRAAIAGYMVVNDLTARDKVRRSDAGAIGADWVAAKGSPGFLPTGPYFVPAPFIPDPQDLEMTLKVNGEIKQQDRTSGMTFDIVRQLEFLTTFARLTPGDILCTGTPAGNGVATGTFLQDGDLMEASIEGLGTQSTRCVRPTT